ncbi:MAG: peptide-methionine (S)-S-oxide reductase [Proteobacteria bacterium]|nr:peptide-methionine (S)-S-oxide reductase [Pseudomonadota bacterium]
MPLAAMSKSVTTRPSAAANTKRSGQLHAEELVEVRGDGAVHPRAARAVLEEHDPTQRKNRQGNDVNPQYRSLILYSDDKRAARGRHRRARRLLQKAAEQGRLQRHRHRYQAAGEIPHGPPAENHHWDYWSKSPRLLPEPSCHRRALRHFTWLTRRAPSTTTRAAERQAHRGAGSRALPYCARFKKDVTDAYAGSVSLSFREAHQLEGLTLKTSDLGHLPCVHTRGRQQEVASYQAPAKGAVPSSLPGAGCFQARQEPGLVAFGPGTDSRYCQLVEFSPARRRVHRQAERCALVRYS